MVQCVICTSHSQEIHPTKQGGWLISRPSHHSSITRIVQNATDERLGYQGQFSMEKYCSQMAKVRRTLHSHSLTPLSILSLPLSPSPTLLSLSLSFSLSFSLHFLSLFCLWRDTMECWEVRSTYFWHFLWNPCIAEFQYSPWGPIHMVSHFLWRTCMHIVQT